MSTRMTAMALLGRALLGRALLGWALLGAGALPAQDAPGSAQRLRALLLELAGIDAQAWTARLAELEQQAKAQDARGVDLRAQAAKLQKDAEAADNEAKTLRAEMQRLQQLQALAAGLPKAATPATPPQKTEATPTPKPEPAPKTDMVAPSAPAVAGDKISAKDKLSSEDSVTWEHVAPIFREHCASCHDPDDKEGGLDLTSFAAARQGGGSGETLTPGEPEQSRLYRLITRQERPFMPRNADPLPAATIAKVKAWIEQGAAEDANAARAFLARKDAEAKLATASPDAADADGDAPLPHALPEVELRAPARAAAVKSLARSPRAPLLALPGLQQIRLLDADLNAIGVLPCPLTHVDAVTFSADGRLLLAAGGDPGRRGRAVLYDVRTGGQLGEFGTEKDVPLAAAVDGRRGLVALGGSSKQVRVHRTKDGSLAFAGKHDDFVLGLAFAASGEWLAAADRSGVVKVWETSTGRLEQTLTGHRGAVHAVAFHRGGKLLASVGADGTLRMWDVAEGKEKWRQTAHQGDALAVALGPDDSVATCGSDGRIKLFTGQGRDQGTSPVLGEWLYSVAFGADGKTVFAGDWQGRTHRFAVK